jgi:catechol 2,3-dioxygenase-like lactoylglutathione lyase family enzyme
VSVIGIDHVQVAAPAGGEEQARAFYGGLLGLEEIPKPPLLAVSGGCWFRVGAQELHIGADTDFTAAHKAHPGFVVDDLDALVERIRASGIEVTPDERIPGVRRVYVPDPFGNRLELRQA